MAKNESKLHIRREFNLKYRAGMLLLAVLILLPWYFVTFNNKPQSARLFGITVAMSFLWAFEVVPLGVTSLLPLVLLPLSGIQSANDVAKNYFGDTQFLFFGSFLLARAVEHCRLLDRLALRILVAVTSPRKIILAILVLSWFLSAWMQNTAVASLLVPLVLSMISTVKTAATDDEQQLLMSRWSQMSLLSVAYGASLGGLVTPIGTAPNLVFFALVAQKYPNAPPVSFLTWMLFAVPYTIVVLLLFWLVGAFVFCRGVHRLHLSLDEVKREYDRLGPMTSAERLALAIVGVQIVLWTTRGNGANAADGFGGWSAWFAPGVAIGDGTVSIFIAVLLFVLPTHVVRWEEQREINAIVAESGGDNAADIAATTATTMEMMPIDDDGSLDSVESVSVTPAESPTPTTTTVIDVIPTRIILSMHRRSMRDRVRGFVRRPLRATSFLIEKDVHDIPWPVVLLLGAGFALADAFDKTGAMRLLAASLRPTFESLSPTGLLALVVAIVGFCTEFMSNTAIAVIFMPLVEAIAVCKQLHPFFLMIPNAIAFASGHVRMKTMLIMGTFLSVLSIVLMLLAMLLYGNALFGIDLNQLPVWVNATGSCASDIASNSTRTSTVISSLTSTMATSMI